MEKLINYDIDPNLRKLISLIWSGKWIIFSTILASLALSSFYLVTSEPIYEAKMSIRENIRPAFLNEGGSLLDMALEFKLKTTFERWKKENTKTKLEYGNLVDTVDFDAFASSNSFDRKILSYQINRDTMDFILLSNNSDTIKSIHSYFQYINQVITNAYKKKVLDELAFINEKNMWITNDVVHAITINNLFLERVNEGIKLFKINPPTAPRKVSPKLTIILVLSFIVGGILGCLCILVASIHRLRFKQL